MHHFYVWNFNRRRRLVLITFIILVVALFLMLEPTRFFLLFSKDQQTALTRGNKDEHKLALTFNISWGEEKVHDILEVLNENEIRATFFLSGEWAERHPQIVEEITEQQHEIAMLGYRYKSYLEQDLDQVRKDIIYAKEVFGKLGFKEINYIRPPSGHFNKEIITLVEQLQLEAIHWSVNPNDWQNPGVNEIASHVLNKSSGGDVILLHASDVAKQTAEALQIVLPELLKKDLQFVTISELFNEVNVKEKLVN